MSNRFQFLTSVSITCLLLLTATDGQSFLPRNFPENHAPTVKITNPANNSSFAAGTRIPYSISVSDPEDGESKYEEINPKEVFLEVQFIENDNRSASLMKTDDELNDPGFMVLRSSNCANCHLFKGKLIGPSYEEISKRYQDNKENADLLSSRILAGTSGVWGQVKMPSHPELNAVQSRNIVKWILKNGKNENLNFITGVSGSIQLTLPAGASNHHTGEFILTASYVDHGSNGNDENKLNGSDRIVIHLR